MQIRIQSTGQVMYEGDFRTLFPNTSLPQQLTEALINELGGDVVFEGPQATGGDHYQYSQADGVEQVDGKWYTKYVLGPVFADTTDLEGNVTTAAQNEASYKAGKDAVQATAVRKQRDEKLTETDWRYRRDQTTTQAWDDYCQALRDVPSQSGFPWEVTWPTKPE
jgi:hypothetical protein